MMSRLPECRIVVITLGLVEAWYDSKTEMFLNAMPPAFAIKEEPQRFQLRTLDLDEIVASLERIHGLITRYGHPDFKMLITVSPVPFKATMTGTDALIANTYGKSVQRAAAEVFNARHDNVNYFPSYEMVTLSERAAAYEADNIHVTRPMVEHIMATVVAAYAPSVSLSKAEEPRPENDRDREKSNTRSGLLLEAKQNLSDGNFRSAITNLSSLLYRFSNKLRPAQLANAHLKLGVALFRTKQANEAVQQLKIAKTEPRAPQHHILSWLRLGASQAGR
ncbi:hypothetical protein EBB79_22325 (plasmid) [Parasedimentitalea marina]|uniref:GSCFA domain-containing protein n=1 Tax=Parasedimentitalea marina TaxID=2483033 RepID=A0A3T0N9M3_9RHOB|nr:GSCFA domain-containing protein [Parasedimentitalea marina]AZV80689.1 hypothetical protein EBB79_22325 [Parasedimentitalea marina]